VRTTLDLPDALYRRLKLQAAKEGKTLKELVIRYLEEGLSRKAPSKRPLPQVPEAGRRIRPRIHAELWELLDPPDLNVWFALLVPEHPFHGRARSYWEEAENPASVRATALALVRLLTNPKAMDGKPLAVGGAWALYRALREAPPGGA